MILAVAFSAYSYFGPGVQEACSVLILAARGSVANGCEPILNERESGAENGLKWSNANSDSHRPSSVPAHLSQSEPAP